MGFILPVRQSPRIEPLGETQTLDILRKDESHSRVASLLAHLALRQLTLRL